MAFYKVWAICLPTFEGLGTAFPKHQTRLWSRTRNEDQREGAFLQVPAGLTYYRGLYNYLYYFEGSLL